MNHPILKRNPRLHAVVEAALKAPDALMTRTWEAVNAMPDERRRRLVLRFCDLSRRPLRGRILRSMQKVVGGPGWSAERKRAAWTAHIRHISQSILEVLEWERMPLEQLHESLIIEGADNLRAALRGGKGAMIFMNHIGNFISVAPALHQLGIPFCWSGNALQPKVNEGKLRGIVQRTGGERALVGDDTINAAARTFRRGAALIAFVDFSVTYRRDTWLRLGAAETHVSLGPAWLALRQAVPVLCLDCARLDDGRHLVRIHPPLAIERSRDTRGDMTRLSQQALDLVAVSIRQRPEQFWLWDFVPLRRLNSKKNTKAT